MKSKDSSIAMFLLSPVLGIIEAFKNLRNKQSRITIFLFCLCFGFCFSVGTNRTEGSTDGISVRIHFEQGKNLSGAQYLSYLSDYFEYDSGKQDIYTVTMAYLVGRLTSNYHFFFLALALVFAIFQIKCLYYFVKEENFTNSLVCIILTCLFLWNNIYNINGGRFCTAAWIGLYCVFRIFHDRKPIYLLLSLITPIIHVSFVVFPILIVVTYVIKEYRKPLIALFIVSWIFSFFAEDVQVPFLHNIDLPLILMQKVESYADPVYIKNLSQGAGYYWVGLLFKALSRNYINLLILFIALNDYKIKDIRSLQITRFMLVLAIVANFGMVVPTFGNRFLYVDYALVAYSFLVVFGDHTHRKLIYALPFVWFMNIFRLCIDVAEVIDLGFVLPPIFSFIRYLFV